MDILQHKNNVNAKEHVHDSCFGVVLALKKIGFCDEFAACLPNTKIGSL